MLRAYFGFRVHFGGMGSTSAVKLQHLQGVYALLDDLQAGFILVDPEGQIAHASYWLRRLLPRRATRGSALDTLGETLYEQLCAPVLSGDSAGERWREGELAGRDEGVRVQVSIRSTLVEYDAERRGVLLSIHDVSSEVGLHKQNKALLEQQREINANLRREIAKQLRAHEDDISQLNEILEIAPAIFASFVGEAEQALDAAGKVIADKARDAELVVSTLRDLHTLKGNARSLGLNFIGGRAHSVEDILGLVPKAADEARRQKLLGDLAETVEDLRRAKDRASFVRSRLGATSVAQPQVDVQQHERLNTALQAIRETLAALPADHESRAKLEEAEAIVQHSSERELQELFEFLRATAAKVSRNLAIDCPIVDARGGSIRVGAKTFSALSTALPHIVRNAICHGIEPAEERLEHGKAALGAIDIAAELHGSQLHISVADDGRGIDTEKLRLIAESLGVPAPKDEREVALLLLHPGVSTADTVDEDKGRGMGSAAAHSAIQDIGGDISLRFEAHEGTTFTIEIPAG